MTEKVYEKYFTGIYSFEEVLLILCMIHKKNQGYLSFRKSLKMVHFDVDFKLIYFNRCSYRGAESLFNNFLNEGECV